VAKLIINPTAANRRELLLSKEQILTIGRDPSNDLVLPDAMVSRRHAVIESRGSQFFLRDCSSANGSVVNGDRVSERGLRDGDLVAIGSMRLLFREEPGEPGAKVVPHPSAAPFRCPSCGSDYRRGDLFCRECGTQVAQPSGPPRAVCASCGSAVPLPARFCNACGSTLATDGHRMESAPEASPVASPADRELSKRETQRVTRVPEREEPGWSGSPAAPAAALQAEPEPSPRSTDPSRRVAPAASPRRERRPAASRVSASSGPSPLAGAGRRLAAALIDSGLVLAIQAVILAPAGVYWWSRTVPADPADVAFLPIAATVSLGALAALVGALYFVYFWGSWAATPGKELLALRVEAEDGSYPIGLPRAALRLLGYLLSAASLGVGFLMIAIGGSGLHDRIAGTRVARTRRP